MILVLGTLPLIVHDGIAWVGNKLPPLGLPETRKAVELFHSTEPQRAATWFEAEVDPDQKRAAQADAAAHKLVREALMRDRENDPRLADMVMLRAIKLSGGLWRGRKHQFAEH